MQGTDRERVRQYIARLDRARATLAEELEPEVALVRDLSLSDRGRWVASACQAASAIIQARKRLGSWAEMDEAPAPDFAVKWHVLMTRYRGMRRDRK